MPASYLKIGGELISNAILLNLEVKQELNQHWWCSIECRQTEDSRFPIEESLGKDVQVLTYDQEGAEQLEQFPDAPIEGIRIIYDNLLDDGDMVRHDPEKLANLILSCVKTSSPKKVGSI